MPVDKFNNAKWNALVGKKILLIKDGGYGVQTAVITGCDPDIGICVNSIGDPNPEVIMLGPSAPNYKNRTSKPASKRKDFLYEAFKELQSGYLSYYTFERRFQNFYGSSSVYNPAIHCPYSM